MADDLQLVDYLLDRLDGLCPLVAAGDRAHAERVLAICRDRARGTRRHQRSLGDASDAEIARELMRLTELLGRRSSHALPFATLGRAALAALDGDEASRLRAVKECERQLALLGL